MSGETTTGADASAEIRELAESVFADAWDASRAGFAAELWKTCEQTGLARLTLPETAGGSGASFTEAAAVLEAAGQYAARVPLVETDLLGGWLLHAAGIEVPAGPLTAAVAPAGAGSPREGAVSLRGVPWAGAAAGIAVLAGESVQLFDRAAVEVADAGIPAGARSAGAADADAARSAAAGRNLAEEPREDVTLSGAPRAEAPAPEGLGAELELRAALGRALLLAGAARGALAMAVRYAGERVQFGRPIGRFQAIQQELALAAAEVAAASAAAQAAARAADARGVVGAELAIAAAKVRCGEAAGVIARIAHQVHGALGFTREHDLRLLTTRLWAWRDEAGSEAYWAERLGSAVLDAGADGLWPLIVTT